MKNIKLPTSIVDIRPMTKTELKNEGWEDTPACYVPNVIVLYDGTKLYASQDDEGNGPGRLFGTNPTRPFLAQQLWTPSLKS